MKGKTMIFGLKRHGPIYAADETVIGGYNTENADLDNPTGAWFKRVFVAQVNLGEGETYRHDHVFDEDQADALKRLIDKMNAHLDAGGELNKDHWRFFRLIYGSDAYIKQGGEHEEMMVEAKEDGRFIW